MKIQKPISFRAMKLSHAIKLLKNLYTQEKIKIKGTNNVLVYNKHSFDFKKSPDQILRPTGLI